MISDDESDAGFPMQRLTFLPFMQYLTFAIPAFFSCSHLRAYRLTLPSVMEHFGDASD